MDGEGVAAFNDLFDKDLHPSIMAGKLKINAIESKILRYSAVVLYKKPRVLGINMIYEKDGKMTGILHKGKLVEGLSKHVLNIGKDDHIIEIYCTI